MFSRVFDFGCIFKYQAIYLTHFFFLVVATSVLQQAQLNFAGKSRYIGVFDTREKAALAYEIAREKLKKGPKDHLDPKATENLVNQARKAAFEGVNEKLTMKK